MITILNSLPYLAFLLAILVALRFPAFPVNLRPVHVAGVFSLLFLVEYYVLGDSSFVQIDDEGDYIVPFLEFITSGRELGKYSPVFMGGVDLYSVNATGMQYLNWDNIWFGLFPTWIALLVHKAAVLAVALTGAFLVLRRLCNLSPLLSMLIACLYCVTPWRDGVTVNVGLGYMLLPLAIYVISGRLEERRYFLPVAAFCLLSATTPLTHILPAIIDSAVAAWVLLGCRRPGRLVAGLALVVGASLVNWHEVTWAAILTSTESFRASADVYPVLQDNLFRAFDALRWYYFALWLVPIAVLARFGDRRLLRLVAGTATIFGLYVAPFLMPWEKMGLATLRYISYDSFIPAIQASSLIGIGWALGHVEANWPRHWRLVGRLSPAHVVICMIVAFMVFQKSLYLRQFLAIGGQAQYHAIDNLRDPDWLGSEPVRTVALGYRYPARNIIEGFYGLDGFGGKFNVFPRAVTEFWNFGVARVSGLERNLFPVVPFQYEFFDRATNSVDIEGLANLELLAAANVGFIASEYPLRSARLTLVSGPDAGEPVYAGRPGLDGIAERLGYQVRRAVSGGPIYVYRIAGYLPRAYGASRLETFRAPELSVRDRLMFVAGNAADRVALVEAADASLLGRPDGVPVVDRLVYGIDRITMELTAPAAGIVILNAPHSRFWKVFVDGVETPVVPANHVQMAVPVPAGAGTVEMLYCRPMLREIALGWLAGETATGCPGE